MPTDAATPHSSQAADVVTVIRGGVRGPSFAVLREVVVYRGVLYALVRRAITTRYRQSIGGIIWIFAGPLSTAAGYALFLGRVAGVNGDKGTDYILFALVGTVIWGIFLRGGIGGFNALVGNQAFVTKVYFPRVMLPLATIGQSLADLVPATGMMFVIAMLVGQPPRVSWLLVVVPFFTVTVVSSAFALAGSAINVYVRDLNYATPLVQQFGLLASAVVFPLSAINSHWRTTFAIVNPIAGAIDNARAVVYRGDGLDAVTTLGGLAFSLFVLLIAFLLFSMLERNAADRI